METFHDIIRYLASVTEVKSTLRLSLNVFFVVMMGDLGLQCLVMSREGLDHSV